MGHRKLLPNNQDCDHQNRLCLVVFGCLWLSAVAPEEQRSVQKMVQPCCKSLLETDVEQNGTIPFQNGTPLRPQKLYRKSRPTQITLHFSQLPPLRRRDFEMPTRHDAPSIPSAGCKGGETKLALEPIGNWREGFALRKGHRPTEWARGSQRATRGIPSASFDRRSNNAGSQKIPQPK